MLVSDVPRCLWSYWLTLLLALPTAGFLVRLFVIQHDCGHHSFFSSRRANDVFGVLCGIITITPYHLWRRTHGRRRSPAGGDLNHRGHGDVGKMTVKQSLGRSTFGRLGYRFYRHPLIMFFAAASYQFIVRQRLTQGVPRSWRRERNNVYVTNLAILAVVAAAWCIIGVPTFLLVELPLRVAYQPHFPPTPILTALS